MDVNEVYDIATDSWSTKTPLPVSDAYMQACVVDSKIFVVTDVALYVYDPVNDSWTNITNTPTTSITHAFSAMVNNKIIIVDQATSSSEIYGGGFRTNVEMKVMIYDTKTNVWSEGQTSPKHTVDIKPIPAGATTGVYAPKKIYVLGVQYLDDYTKQPFNWVYDSVEDTWSTATKPSKVCSDCSVAVVDDILYVIGGKVNGQYVPIGYDPLGYQTPPDASDVTISPVPSEPEYSWAFLTDPVIAIIVLTAGIVVITSLFFYLKGRRERNKRDTYA